MSYAQGTTHYNFPQIAGTDRPTFADANEAFRTLDTKLYALEGSATDVDARLDTAEGNIVQLQSDVQTAQGTADLAKSTADTAVEEIGITNTNVSQLTTRVSNKLDSVAIADPYDTTQQYAVDDVVTYNGQRYRCTTAVTVAEPFDVTKWTGEDVETVLDGINSDLANKSTVTITSHDATIENVTSPNVGVYDCGAQPAGTFLIPIFATVSGYIPCRMALTDNRYIRVYNESGSTTNIAVRYLKITIN